MEAALGVCDAAVSRGSLAEASKVKRPWDKFPAPCRRETWNRRPFSSREEQRRLRSRTLFYCGCAMQAEAVRRAAFAEGQAEDVPVSWVLFPVGSRARNSGSVLRESRQHGSFSAQDDPFELSDVCATGQECKQELQLEMAHKEARAADAEARAEAGCKSLQSPSAVGKVRAVSKVLGQMQEKFQRTLPDMVLRMQETC